MTTGGARVTHNDCVSHPEVQHRCCAALSCVRRFCRPMAGVYKGLVFLLNVRVFSFCFYNLINQINKCINKDEGGEILSNYKNMCLGKE